MFIIIGYILVFIIMFLAAMALVGGLKHKGSISRALDMSIFLITFPPKSHDSSDKRSDTKLITVMEDLFNSFSKLHAKGWNKFVYGEPYIALEMAVHHLGQEIHFYIAVPRGYEQTLEEKIHRLYQDADIQQVEDYNIFAANSIGAGSYFLLDRNPILPIKTHRNLHIDPLNEIVNSFSELKNEGEGAVIQILVRPSHRDKIKMLTKKFKKNIQFKGDMLKLIEAKVTNTIFDTNIRVTASAGTENRAGHVLDSINYSFTQFSSGEMNRFRSVRVNKRYFKDMLFKISFRIFDNSQVCFLSSEELASIFHFPLSSTFIRKVKFSKSNNS